MSPRFNAGEVLEMAIEIEQNGEKYYRRAADLAQNDEVRRYLLELAAMEAEHAATFARMRDRLLAANDPAAFDPYEEGALYLDALADSHGGEGAPAALEALTPASTLEEILATAVELEKKSILFYLGVRSMVVSDEDCEHVDKIIREEKSHIVLLTAKLREIRNPSR